MNTTTATSMDNKMSASAILWTDFINEHNSDTCTRNLIVPPDTTASFIMIAHNATDASRDITIKIAKNASFHFYGIVLGTAQTRFMLNVRVIHEDEESKSNTIIRGILHKKSSVIIDSAIVVRKNATHSEGAFHGKILLHNKQARARITPNLEICNDSARASHGVSIGQVSPDDLYYLASRGVSKKDATALIERGFLNDILQRIPETHVITKAKKWLSI